VKKLNLFGGTISSLEKGLSYATTKNKAIAQNIANVDTPGYKAKDVSFKAIFEDAQNTSISSYKSNARHYDFSITQQGSGAYSKDHLRARVNGNGVNMDAEQAKLAENTIYYNALIERVSSKYNTLNTVIKGGK
jgi:flagellar basal-body rod protein FlgB